MEFSSATVGMTVRLTKIGKRRWKLFPANARFLVTKLGTQLEQTIYAQWTERMPSSPNSIAEALRAEYGFRPAEVTNLIIEETSNDNE